jgi:hypothetical protein
MDGGILFDHESLRPYLGVGKNPQTDSNRTIRTEKWSSGRDVVDRGCQSHIFNFRRIEMSGFDFLKLTQRYPNPPKYKAT